MAAIALTGALSLVMAGCGGGDSSTEDNTDDPTAAAADLGTPNKATGTPVKIGVVGQDALDQDLNIAAYRATTEYANEYLGGINGHVIELDECTTNRTPAAATQCGVQFAKNKVVAVLISSVGDQLQIYKAMQGSGIPYITQITADIDILGGPDAFIMSNPTGVGSATIAVAKQNDVKKAAIIVVDVPAAAGPVKQLSVPLYEEAKIALDFIPISPQVADPTAQVQQAIGNGDEAITIFGDNSFVTTVLKSAKQLGFKGLVFTQITSFPEDQVASIPGGLEGVYTFSSISKSDDAADRPLFEAVMEKYGDDIDLDRDETPGSYQVEKALIDAVNLTPDAGTDAASVLEALKGMPRPIPLPLGGGITFQCGADKVAVLPNVCLAEVLQSELDADGKPIETEVLTPADAAGVN